MKRRAHMRLATEYDVKRLTELELLAFETDRFTRDQIEYLLTRSRTTIIVLEYKGVVAGAAYILWRKAHMVARLYNLAVDPAYQGLKFGTTLLEECELEAARRGCWRMILEVRQDNDRAIGFYERHGYVITRSLPDYYDDGMVGLKMSKDLNIKVPEKIRLRVPYYYQSLDFTCGPASMMMVLKYFHPKTELNRSLEMTLWKEATLVFTASGFGGTGPYGLALSAINRGLGCHVITTLEAAPLTKSVRNKLKREVMAVVHSDMKRRARKAGASTAVFHYGIAEIISALHRGMIPVALISTYRLTGDQVPHWVVITGFDKKYLYIHDPDVESYRRKEWRARNLPIEQAEFLRMSRYGKEVYRCLLLFEAPNDSARSRLRNSAKS